MIHRGTSSFLQLIGWKRRIERVERLQQAVDTEAVGTAVGERGTVAAGEHGIAVGGPDMLGPDTGEPCTVGLGPDIVGVQHIGEQPVCLIA
jgi:hypothetical protein